MTDPATPLLPGDVLLTRSQGWVGRLIRFGEHVRYAGWRHALTQGTSPSDPWWVNHAAVYIGDGQVIEALAAGLTMSKADKYGPGTYRVARLGDVDRAVGPFERQAALTFAQTQLARHDRYGWLSIASIVVQLLTPARLDVSWDGALICSAFAAQCWEHAGIVLPTRSSLTTMPADLAHMAAQAAAG